MYEDYSGRIAKIEVSNKTLSRVPNRIPDFDQPIPFYVYTEEQFKKLVRSGRPLDDIAVVRDSVRGRNGKMIDSLYWGKDARILVRYGDKTLLQPAH